MHESAQFTSQHHHHHHHRHPHHQKKKQRKLTALGSPRLPDPPLGPAPNSQEIDLVAHIFVLAKISVRARRDDVRAAVVAVSAYMRPHGRAFLLASLLFGRVVVCERLVRAEEGEDEA